MHDELNVTYITLNGYVDVHKYRYLYFLTLQIVLYHPFFNPLIYGLKMKEISVQPKSSEV